MERYEYLETISSGAYGVCYKVLDTTTGQHCAAKGIKLAHEDAEVMRLTLREVKILKALPPHVNLVKLLEAFRSNSGRVYLVFEFVERSLYQELDRHPSGALPPPMVKSVAWQLLHALAHCHDNGIMHRDIKPANILLTGYTPGVGSGGVVKLCDFGFARQITCSGNCEVSGSIPYGRSSGGARGAGGTGAAAKLSSYVMTRWYRPPEVLVGDMYGPPIDLWSYGCTLAELATGRPLFPGRSSLDQLWRIMRCLGSLPHSQTNCLRRDLRLQPLWAPPPRLKSLRQRLPDLDPRLYEVIAACLALDPDRRPTVRQLLQLPYFWDVGPLIADTDLARQLPYAADMVHSRSPPAAVAVRPEAATKPRAMSGSTRGRSDALMSTRVAAGGQDSIPVEVTITAAAAGMTTSLVGALGKATEAVVPGSAAAAAAEATAAEMAAGTATAGTAPVEAAVPLQAAPETEPTAVDAELKEALLRTITERSGGASRRVCENGTVGGANGQSEGEGEGLCTASHVACKQQQQRRQRQERQKQQQRPHPDMTLQGAAPGPAQPSWKVEGKKGSVAHDVPYIPWPVCSCNAAPPSSDAATALALGVAAAAAAVTAVVAGVEAAGTAIPAATTASTTTTTTITSTSTLTLTGTGASATNVASRKHEGAAPAAAIPVRSIDGDYFGQLANAAGSFPGAAFDGDRWSSCQRLLALMGASFGLRPAAAVAAPAEAAATALVPAAPATALPPLQPCVPSAVSDDLVAASSQIRPVRVTAIISRPSSQGSAAAGGCAPVNAGFQELQAPQAAAPSSASPCASSMAAAMEAGSAAGATSYPAVTSFCSAIAAATPGLGVVTVSAGALATGGASITARSAGEGSMLQGVARDTLAVGPSVTRRVSMPRSEGFPTAAVAAAATPTVASDSVRDIDAAALPHLQPQSGWPIFPTVARSQSFVTRPSVAPAAAPNSFLSPASRAISGSSVSQRFAAVTTGSEARCVNLSQLNVDSGALRSDDLAVLSSPCGAPQLSQFLVHGAPMPHRRGPPLPPALLCSSSPTETQETIPELEAPLRTRGGAAACNGDGGCSQVASGGVVPGCAFEYDQLECTVSTGPCGLPPAGSYAPRSPGPYSSDLHPKEPRGRLWHWAVSSVRTGSGGGAPPHPPATFVHTMRWLGSHSHAEGPEPPQPQPPAADPGARYPGPMLSYGAALAASNSLCRVEKTVGGGGGGLVVASSGSVGGTVGGTVGCITTMKLGGRSVLTLPRWLFPLNRGRQLASGPGGRGDLLTMSASPATGPISSLQSVQSHHVLHAGQHYLHPPADMNPTSTLSSTCLPPEEEEPVSTSSILGASTAANTTTAATAAIATVTPVGGSSSHASAAVATAGSCTGARSSLLPVSPSIRTLDKDSVAAAVTDCMAMTAALHDTVGNPRGGSGGFAGGASSLDCTVMQTALDGAVNADGSMILPSDMGGLQPVLQQSYNQQPTAAELWVQQPPIQLYGRARGKTGWRPSAADGSSSVSTKASGSAVAVTLAYPPTTATSAAAAAAVLAGCPSNSKDLPAFPRVTISQARLGIRRSTLRASSGSTSALGSVFGSVSRLGPRSTSASSSAPSGRSSPGRCMPCGAASALEPLLLCLPFLRRQRTGGTAGSSGHGGSCHGGSMQGDGMYDAAYTGMRCSYLRNDACGSNRSQNCVTQSLLYDVEPNGSPGGCRIRGAVGGRAVAALDDESMRCVGPRALQAGNDSVSKPSICSSSLYGPCSGSVEPLATVALLSAGLGVSLCGCGSYGTCPGGCTAGNAPAGSNARPLVEGGCSAVAAVRLRTAP